MDLDDLECYWTRKHKGLISETETVEYIRKLEKRNFNLEQIEKEHKEENGQLRIKTNKLEKKYYIVLRLLIFIVIIWNIHILVLATRIEQKDNEIWQQKIELEDLKEQLDRERINK